MANKTVALVSAHFPPSNLAGVHRVRLLSQHLHEFGWRPIVVTTHWQHYEEELDWGLASIVDPSLEIIRTKAFPTRPFRLVGDIGIRALPWHYAALRRLIREKRIDFVHITVPSFYSALLGQLLHRETAVPFGIDYQDPWVHVWPAAEIKFSKAWVSMKLGAALEPWAVRNAVLITGVGSEYFAGVLLRNPHLRSSCVTAAMPIGFSVADFSAPETAKRPALFDPGDGCFHIVYAGALLPRAHSVLEQFLFAVKLLRDRGNKIANQLRLHFIGTGKSPKDKKGYNVLPVAKKLQLVEIVTEHPHRMAYLDVLAHLKNAYGVLILGSTESHYTPSKVYQAVQSRRPVLALLHDSSTAVEVVEQSKAGTVIKILEGALPDPEEIASILEAFCTQTYSAENVKWEKFDQFSARASARRMAAALSLAFDRHRGSEKCSSL